MLFDQLYDFFLRITVVLCLSARFRFIAALFLSSLTAACWLSDIFCFGFSMFISEMAIP